MQDQGKRLLIAVALALGVMLVYNLVFHNEEPPPAPSSSTQAPPKPATPQVGVTTGGAPAAPGSAGQAAGPAGVMAPPAEEAPRPPEQVIELPFDNVVATFSSHCGGLTSWQLTDKRYKHDATQGQMLPAKGQLMMKGPSGKRGPVPPEQLANLPACGAFDVNFASSTFVVPRNAVWKGEQVSGTEVRYTYASDRLELVKAFTVMPERYLVRMVLTVNVRVPEGTLARQQLAVSVFSFQDPAGLEGGSRGVSPRVWSSATMRDGKIVATEVTGVLEWPRFEPGVQWTGFEHPYLLAGYAPRVHGGARVEKFTSAADGNAGQPRGLMRTDLLFPQVTFKPGSGPVTHEIVGYLGPKNYDDLYAADAAAGFETGFHEVVDLGWFAFIGRPLLWLLQKFEQLFGNWAISIILLTFLVKAATLYWTTKSMRSMKEMGALAPQLKALQVKYANDKQRQQTETMALYKEHGVNPVAGCLPILMQMPIWLALYRMLSSAGELYQQPFIPGWIDDLTTTDPYYVLPAILVATMFFQARLSPPTGDSRQQKFLQYGMPLMFGAMSLAFPAGLTLYMFTNTVLGALHSVYMNKFDKKSLAIAARLKKNQESAEAALVTPPAGTAKPGGPGAAKPNGKGATAKARRLIDVKSTEVPVDSRDDDGADTEEAPVDALGAAGPGPARNRPRRKKRRR